MLKSIFAQLLERYPTSHDLASTLWSELETSYSEKKRYYHTIQHLDNMYQKLLEVKGNIENWEAVLFALYYHDAVYNSLKSDNEEKSAVLAESRMEQIGVHKEIITSTVELILATKKHTASANTDINYFTDSDLAILGQPWPAYETYFKNVRKEYSIYPDLIYKPGRRKVLKHFLEMERIFKTDYFHFWLEQQAKQNLGQELDLLN